MKTARLMIWFKNCCHGAMKLISYQAVRNGNGYVRPTFGESTEANRPSTKGLVVAGILLALTATFVGLMLLGVSAPAVMKRIGEEGEEAS